MTVGYHGRYITYTGTGFIEGVSLSYEDELIKFKKYAYGTCEMLFNPVGKWIYKGPINKTIKDYLNSDVEMSSKVDLMAYLFTYIALSIGLILMYVNYFLYGWYSDAMDTVVPSVNVMVQISILFSGWGLFAHAAMKARILKKDVINILWENIVKIPLYMFFFGSLQYHLLKIVMLYFWGKNKVSWGSTSKETTLINKKNALKQTIMTYWDMYLFFGFTLIMIIVLWTPYIPNDWRITSTQGIAPLLVSTILHLSAPIALNPHIVSEKMS